MIEAVNHPAHYGGDSQFETIKVLEAWLTPEQRRGFNLGNAIKYISRAGKKGDSLEDLRKARWYLDREIGQADELKPLVLALADRVHKQSELLSRKAEAKPVVLSEVDSCP